ncbi:MAG: hypothetical protein WDM78_05430 [Puia sp.]
MYFKPGTMAAVLALEDEQVESICREVESETGEVLVAANFNCPGQVVISGSLRGIEIGCEKMKAAGARRAHCITGGWCAFSFSFNGACTLKN